MKSAFFILLLLFPFGLVSKTITVANQSGRLKSVNVINNMGYEYSDFEYTTSCIIDEYKKDSAGISFDGKELQLAPNSNLLTYIVAKQRILLTMGMPVLNLSNRICIPIKDYFYALDSLGICKVISSTNDFYKVDDYRILKFAPKISNFANKYNLAYYEQVYNEVNNSRLSPLPKVRKRVAKKVEGDKTLDLIKEALKDEKSEVPTPEKKKDDYYDIPRGLNRDDALQKKKH
ncbi:MAG: hypothetical protein CVV25_08255 [Ignavibacteriae bacterium HGW-Ignavibacteriae-4]|nr:MAG: hypothetical protein CVV25_08255 [Ignavibacteriae bacterium HGW-Ignavibacteriae-4]